MHPYKEALKGKKVQNQSRYQSNLRPSAMVKLSAANAIETGQPVSSSIILPKISTSTINNQTKNKDVMQKFKSPYRDPPRVNKQKSGNVGPLAVRLESGTQKANYGSVLASNVEKTIPIEKNKTPQPEQNIKP